LAVIGRLSDEQKKLVIDTVNDQLKGWLNTFIFTHAFCFMTGGVVGFFTGKWYG
jgi:hypothetical protein